MTKQLVINAMNQAINHEKPAEGLIFHSDRGSQYASYDYQGLLRKHGYRQSMSAKGDCYDNACAESFFATIKKECIRLERFKTRSEARLKIVDYIVWYNAKRRHSYLGNISPLEFEKQYYQNILGEAAQDGQTDLVTIYKNNEVKRKLLRVRCTPITPKYGNKKERIKELEKKNAILKKAMSIFAKDGK